MNSTDEDCLDISSMARDMHEIKLFVKDLVDDFKNLYIRNEELEKENKRLRETIRQMSQRING